MRARSAGHGAGRARLAVITGLFAAGVALGAHGPVSPPDPVYRGPEDSERVALAVNVDWGEEHLGPMLKTCEDKAAVLTFFVTGRWALNNPELLRVMAAGHEIGNHGYAHPHPDRLSVADNARDIQRAEDAIVSIVGWKPRLYAPPYGERGPTVLEASRSCGYVTVLWSLDTVDWSCQDAEVIRRRAVTGAGPGAIVLMHPTEATAAALPAIIDDLRSKGLELATISELLRLPEAE